MAHGVWLRSEQGLVCMVFHVVEGKPFYAICPQLLSSIPRITYTYVYIPTYIYLLIYTYVYTYIPSMPTYIYVYHYVTYTTTLLPLRMYNLIRECYVSCISCKGNETMMVMCYDVL